jgi:hypothetical protein
MLREKAVFDLLLRGATTEAAAQVIENLWALGTLPLLPPPLNKRSPTGKSLSLHALFCSSETLFKSMQISTMDRRITRLYSPGFSAVPCVFFPSHFGEA